jgi:hypothetical protein
MTDEDKEGLAREKNRYRKASTGIYYLSLSLSTSSRLQQSQQTNPPAEAQHGEEKKAHGNRNKSYVTISSEQIHQEYNSKSLEMFFLLYISHFLLSLSLSRKSRRTEKSTKPAHKNATKEPKKRKRKGKKFLKMQDVHIQRDTGNNQKKKHD